MIGSAMASALLAQMSVKNNTQLRPNVIGLSPQAVDGRQDVVRHLQDFGIELIGSLG